MHFSLGLGLRNVIYPFKVIKCFFCVCEALLKHVIRLNLLININHKIWKVINLIFHCYYIFFKLLSH